LKNVDHAGRVLAKVRNGCIIDGFEVIAEYVSPGDPEPNPPSIPSQEWYSTYVQESQYMLQVNKFFDFSNRTL